MPMNDGTVWGATAFGLACWLLALGACREARPTVDEGRVSYHANGCANCHGPTGQGDGPVGKTLATHPRDFRDPSGFKNGIDVSAIAATLAAGLTRNGAQMPKFDHLTEHERESIALFVISLRDGSKAPKGRADPP